MFPVMPPMTFPNFIGNLNSSTIPFETRFVRNLIDGDITLPANMVRELDEGVWSLNGLALTITGLQFGDAIRFAAESGFTFAFGPSGVKLNTQNFATATGNTNSATFTFTTNVTAAQLEQFLEALTFQAGPANPAQTSRTLSYSLNSPTQLTGSVALTLAAPLEQNQIQDMGNQTVLFHSSGVSSVRLDSAITLSNEFIAAYSSAGSLNNSTIDITGWTGQAAVINFASDPGITVNAVFPSIQLISIDGVQVGSYNPFSGSIGLGSTATAATIERLIEAITIDVQLTSQTPTRTITVTVVTPTLPQHGTVTFTGANVVLNDLSESVNVSFSDASYGVYLDTDVTVQSFSNSWGNGKIQVTGLADGDSLIPFPKPGSGFFDPDSGTFFSTNFIRVGTLTGDAASGYTIALGAGASQAHVEWMIESLFLITQTPGPRTIEIKLTDGTAAVGKDTITVNVGYPPTLTDMVDAVDLTAAQAAAGQVLDADVTFKVDSDLEYGGVFISGLKDGDVIDIRTGGDSPISFERIPNTIYDNIVINGRTVGTFYPDTGKGPEIGLRNITTAADVEAILENLVFRTTGTDATRDITIMIKDTNGEADTQVITVTILSPGAKEMSYAILRNVNGTLVPVEHGAGTTGDLNPADLFADGTAPDDFVVQYSGLLNAGQTGFEERSVVSFRDVAPDTVLIVNGVSYPLEGPEGVLVLDLAPGLHKITLQVPYESNMGQVVTTAPTLAFGTAVPPSHGEPWLDYVRTPLFDNVRTVPETLHRVEVTSTTTMPGGEPTARTDVFYVTSLDDVPAQLQALRQKFNLPPNVTLEQTYTTGTEKLGSTGADTLNGTDGSDLLNGGAGDDLLLGSLGADTMEGGSGLNTASYTASNAAVTVDLLKGVGQGGHAEGDAIRNIQNVLGSRFADLLVGDAQGNRLSGGNGADTLRGGEGDDTLSGGSGNDLLEGGTGRDTLDGGLGNDTLQGGGDDDLLAGNTGNDLLLGGDGNDILRGGEGADTLDGGAGYNRATYDSAQSGVAVNLGTGIGSAGDAAGDVLRNITGLWGSAHADTLTGSSAADTLNGWHGDDQLFGGAGNDVLGGGAGDDSLFGGIGDDIFIGGAGADSMDGGEGNDRVTYNASSTGVTVDLLQGIGNGGDAEGDTFFGINQITGSSFDDHLMGSDFADTLLGGLGDDTLSGHDGNDVLQGDAGNDSLTGGDGNDLLRGGEGADVLDGGAGTDTLAYEGSTAGVNINLATGTATGGHATGDVITGFERIVGSSHADSLQGGDANETLSGGAGNDTILGGGGNDLILGGVGQDVLDGGTGINTLSYSGATSGVGVNLETGTGFRGEALGDSIQNFQRVVGSAHGDSLIGGQGNETISGGAGNDSIEAGGGNDVLSGGADIDQFIFSGRGFGSDRITDLAAGETIFLGVDLWGEVAFNDDTALLAEYAHQVGRHVELRFSQTDILRIDNITVDALDALNVFALYD